MLSRNDSYLCGYESYNLYVTWQRTMLNVLVFKVLLIFIKLIYNYDQMYVVHKNGFSHIFFVTHSFPKNAIQFGWSKMCYRIAASVSLNMVMIFAYHWFASFVLCSNFQTKQHRLVRVCRCSWWMYLSGSGAHCFLIPLNTDCFTVSIQQYNVE